MSLFDKEKHKDEKPWYEFPDLIAGPKLFRSRNELREKNLHDTEEPSLERSNIRVLQPVEINSATTATLA